MPEKLARSVVVTPCCRHHSLTERPLLRHSWICAAHSCSSARCFNSALVILTSHNTTVAKPFATFRYYCLMCVYARLGLTVTIVDFPRCRIYREFVQDLLADRSIRTGGCSGLFNFVVLCSYANFRTSYRRIDGISYTVYPGSDTTPASLVQKVLRTERKNSSITKLQTDHAAQRGRDASGQRHA